MSILTGGLGNTPLGRVAAGQSAPPRIMLNGLGAWVARTAKFNRFNTPVVTFYYDDTIPENGPGVPPTPESTYAPGVVLRAADNTLLLPVPNDEGVINEVSSHRPYKYYGTRFETAPRINPAFERRFAKNGDMEYAAWTPDPHSYYNARSIMVYIPERTFVSPTSLGRFKFLAKKMKEMAVNVRMRQDGGKVLIELLENFKVPGTVWRVKDGISHAIKLSGKYDVVSAQTYSGME